jgi:transposase
MSQMTLITGPERRRRWSEDEQRQILAAAFAPDANVRDVSRQYDVATSLIYKWRREAMASGHVPGFNEMVVVPVEPATALAPVAMVEIEVGEKGLVRLPTTTPPALASAIVKALRAR